MIGNCQHIWVAKEGKNEQYPSQALAERLVDVLQVSDGGIFTESRLVEARDEESTKEALMENGHSDDASNKLEVRKMVGVGVRGWVDLEGVTVPSRTSK